MGKVRLVQTGNETSFEVELYRPGTFTSGKPGIGKDIIGYSRKMQ